MSIIDRETNKRYDHFLACAEEAPRETFEQAKDVAALIGEFADQMIDRFRDLDLKVCNADGIRNVEVAIYRWLRESADEPELFMAAEEGFGSIMRETHETNKASVIARLVRDRDFLTEHTGAA